MSRKSSKYRLEELGEETGDLIVESFYTGANWSNL